MQVGHAERRGGSSFRDPSRRHRHAGSYTELTIMPVTTAERAELESFFQSRRGTRVLIVPPAADVARTVTYRARWHRKCMYVMFDGMVSLY